MTSNTLLIVDGMALLFRSFFQTAPSGRFMINEQGVPTNAVQGLIRHLFAAADQIRPTHITVCWDMGKNTFRTEMFDSYKAHRPPPPDELRPQFDLAKAATAALSLQNLGVPGYEADDCIGTIARQTQGTKTYILTGDRDLLQLLHPNQFVWLLQNGYGNWKIYDEDLFRLEYGIEPAQFTFVKALMGDAADGYPGVKGIGEKTALKLIREYKTIDGVLENLTQLTPSVRKKLIEDEEMLRLSEKLAAIHCDVPLSWTFDSARFGGTKQAEALAFMEEHGMAGLRRFAGLPAYEDDDPFAPFE